MLSRFKLFQYRNKKIDTPYVIPKECHSQFKNHMSYGISFLHINIRRVFCFSETWLDETTISNKSLYELPNYTSIHQVRKQKEGEELKRGNSLKYRMVWA